MSSNDRFFNPDHGIKNPANRSVANAAIMGTESIDMEIRKMMVRMNTPPAMRHLPDGGVRGHKSLGRIQQITNSRRFKRRASLSQ